MTRKKQDCSGSEWNLFLDLLGVSRKTEQTRNGNIQQPLDPIIWYERCQLF